MKDAVKDFTEHAELLEAINRKAGLAGSHSGFNPHVSSAIRKAVTETNLKVRPEGLYRSVTLGEAALLLFHFWMGVKDSDIGYADMDLPFSNFNAEFIRTKVELRNDVVEKLLWYSTMLYESGRYWHPTDQPYGLFVKKMLNAKEQFDPLTCLILTGVDDKKESRI